MTDKIAWGRPLLAFLDTLVDRAWMRLADSDDFFEFASLLRLSAPFFAAPMFPSSSAKHVILAGHIGGLNMRVARIMPAEDPIQSHWQPADLDGRVSP